MSLIPHDFRAEDLSWHNTSDLKLDHCLIFLILILDTYYCFKKCSDFHTFLRFDMLKKLSISRQNFLLQDKKKFDLRNYASW